MTTLSQPTVFDTAWSREAGILGNLLRNAGRPRTSVSIGRPMVALEEVVDEARSADWDGYGARPVAPDVACYARALLRALPADWRSKVEIGADPDGEIVFEWSVSPRWILTMTINRHGQIAYSGLFGPSQVNGLELFDGELPSSVASAVGRVANHKALA